MNDEIQNFINAYRDSLEQERDLTFQNLENTRRNTFQNIMGSANTLGMMYSNFPERAKIQYDTNTYLPARNKAQTTYQTGLDKIRSNATDYLNTLADYDAEIASLNKQSKGGSSKGTLLNDAGDYLEYSLGKGSWFYNSNGDPVRFGTTISRSGTPSNEDILDAAGSVLDEDTANRLVELYKKARENGYGNIAINAGNSFAPTNLNFLDDSERAFMDSLGLNFAQ